MILADWQIKEYAEKYGMIEPFFDTTQRDKISYGLSSYGYDIRIGYDFKVFVPPHNSIIVDPLDFDDNCMWQVDMSPETGKEYLVIPPNSFALGVTMERFKIPRNVMTVCVGKSTYARCGIIVNVTPFEPEWEGYATLELSNTTPNPAIIYPGQGIAQLLFFENPHGCQVSYADKKGKYQNQPARIVLAKADSEVD